MRCKMHFRIKEKAVAKMWHLKFSHYLVTDPSAQKCKKLRLK